jgi:hypothetical protein
MDMEICRDVFLLRWDGDVELTGSFCPGWWWLRSALFGLSLFSLVIVEFTILVKYYREVRCLIFSFEEFFLCQNCLGVLLRDAFEHVISYERLFGG